MAEYNNLLLKDFKPRSLLIHEEHITERAKYPVVDAHNHLFGDIDPEEMIRVMDKVGVRLFINVTGNTQFTFVVEGYTGSPRNIDWFFNHYVYKYPGRFACFTMTVFAGINDEILIKDDHFAEKAVTILEEDVSKGACGLKVTKELGLLFKDRNNSIIPVDDERLSPIWKKAGELGIPVLIHTSDPAGFFEPIDRYNEHYFTLSKAPDWGYYGSHYSKLQLLEQRNRMVSRHSGTTFICPHVANYPENLSYVAEFLDTHPNVYIDFSARIDELGRQPYSARDFMIKYQDRIVFGTDMPVKEEVYRTYFRFLETKDEYFDYPDYVGRFGYSRWRIYALNLPDLVLEKIYYKNACRIIPGISI